MKRFLKVQKHDFLFRAANEFLNVQNMQHNFSERLRGAELEYQLAAIPYSGSVKTLANLDLRFGEFNFGGFVAENDHDFVQ